MTPDKKGFIGSGSSITKATCRVTITVTYNGRPGRSPHGPSKREVHKNLASDQIFMARIGFCDKANTCA